MTVKHNPEDYGLPSWRVVTDADVREYAAGWDAAMLALTTWRESERLPRPSGLFSDAYQSGFRHAIRQL